MTSSRRIKIDTFIGCFFYTGCLACVIVNAAYHNWPLVGIALMGVIGSTVGLWFNGSMNGMRFMHDLWRPEDDSQ